MIILDQGVSTSRFGSTFNTTQLQGSYTMWTGWNEWWENSHWTTKHTTMNQQLLFIWWIKKVTNKNEKLYLLYWIIILKYFTISYEKDFEFWFSHQGSKEIWISACLSIATELINIMMCFLGENEEMIHLLWYEEIG